jgi:nitronate monooxygenase
LPKIRTLFTDMFHTDLPIIGAPMFLVSYEELTLAVSQAGGMGTLPLPNYRTTADLEKALRRIREVTSKPIGVNIHLSGKFDWRKQLQVCLDADVKFFIASLGDPGLIVEEVHKCGGKVFADVVSLEQGLKAKRKGVDGLVVVGSGAGGHAGTVPTLILVPYLREKVELPLIAAGGISTGAQMAAALAVGACAVIIGTRLIATPESRAKNEYKQAVLKAGPGDIVLTDQITGNPANWLADSIVNVQENLDLGSRRWLDLWSAGQSVAQVDEEKPAGAIIREMAEEFKKVCKDLMVTVADSR